MAECRRPGASRRRPYRTAVFVDSCPASKSATSPRHCTKSVLNSFVSAKKKENEAFGPCIRAGVATSGFYPVEKDVADMLLQTNRPTREEIRDKILDNPNYKGSIKDASQVALWLHGATVGTFVIMRHEYKQCPFLPSKLKDESGKYIGKVYVVGVVIKTILPGSEEEEEIARHGFRDFAYCDYNLHSFCLVSWQWMGLKSKLAKTTKKYINAVFQPTLQQICNPETSTKTQAELDGLRQDLWNNATIPICSNDFPEEFVHRV